MDNAYLTHHGILGQRWGIRRYQNEDGTLTAAGKRRYLSDVNANNQKSKKNRADPANLKDPERWVREDIGKVKNSVDSVKNISNEIKNIEKNTRRSENKRLDLSKMSDAQLRERINREMLEKQYNSLFNAPEVSKGRETVTKWLEIGGGALGIASAALGIALSVRELKGDRSLKNTTKKINHDW